MIFASYQVGNDPGKHVISEVTNASSPNVDVKTYQEKVLRYTLGRRLHESKHQVWNKRMKKKESKQVQDAINNLTQFESRATSLEKFLRYLDARFAAQKICYPHYSKPQYRIIRWHTWRNRRQADDKAAQRIVNTFKIDKDKDVILAYGTGSGFHAMRGLPSSPTNGFRARVAAKKHQGLIIRHTPEAYTSKTCSRCGGELVPVNSRKTTFKSGNVGPARGIRRCTSADSEGHICKDHALWARDYNAAINIRFNLMHWIKYGFWYFGPYQDPNNITQEKVNNMAPEAATTPFCQSSRDCQAPSGI